ncbi:uncharacterized protein F4822DRAFT_444687 [Hypoxylon trugodes]|uniref:uncharacterized protein n=1 Tax=Hypoxylon trugodes TaxID=326681 RepID=UPI00219EA8C3|nr:uncharacterized protein F4822DRAFT_444687 [Hypoxylon trugodes]KAI1386201.1 hypothetical protein F4822DRAFT_444687 [Hypoxylon trugodes]
MGVRGITRPTICQKCVSVRRLPASRILYKKAATPLTNEKDTSVISITFVDFVPLEIHPLAPIPCALSAQMDYEAGLRQSPCNEPSTHPRLNVKVPHLCSYCHDRKSKLDRQFDIVKSKMSDLRTQIEGIYGRCAKHLDEAGVETSDVSPAVTFVSTRKVVIPKAEGKLNSIATVESVDEPDPVKAFLAKKRQEDDAHLMMISDFR